MVGRGREREREAGWEGEWWMDGKKKGGTREERDRAKEKEGEMERKGKVKVRETVVSE